MRVAVLTSHDSWYWRDLRRAAGAPFHLHCCAFSDLHATVGGVPVGGTAEQRVQAAAEDLSAFDAVLVRTMPPGSLEQVVFRMNALARLEKLGPLVVNPARSLEVAIDKYLTLTRLADAGLLVPATITCQSAGQAMEAFAQLGSDVVVKPIFGSEGRGITRIDDAALALRAFSMLEQLGAVIYLQRYIPHHGHDLRCLVMGEQVFGMRRTSEVDWRTNVSRGAVAEPLEVDERLRQLALTAARAVGCPLAGVDFLPAVDGQLYLLEVNAVPGWKAIGRTLGLDMARLVLEFVERLRHAT